MATESLHSNHNRIYGSNRFVYPVLSRRSNGVSLGVNLNPDKVCNFDCIYCQVDRTNRSETRFIEMDQLLAELRTTLDFITSGEFFGDGPFKDIPPELKRLNDIAFSGDGEPTTYKNFDAIISACASLKQELELDDVKMVLITNASMFHRDHVKAGLQILDENQGEIWAKLEAGTEAYFQIIDRTSFKLQEIVIRESLELFDEMETVQNGEEEESEMKTHDTFVEEFKALQAENEENSCEKN